MAASLAMLLLFLFIHARLNDIAMDDIVYEQQYSAKD